MIPCKGCGRESLHSICRRCSDIVVKKALNKCRWHRAKRHAWKMLAVSVVILIAAKLCTTCGAHALFFGRK